VALGAQVVDLVGFDPVKVPDEAGAVGQVRVVEEEPRLRLVRIAIEMVDPARVERAGAADQPVDLVALLQEQLGEVGAVLAGDPG